MTSVTRAMQQLWEEACVDELGWVVFPNKIDVGVIAHEVAPEAPPLKSLRGDTFRGFAVKYAPKEIENEQLD